MRYALIDGSRIVQNIVIGGQTLGIGLPAGWTSAQVPDGTYCAIGSTANGDGTYTVPPLAADQIAAQNGDAMAANIQAAMAQLRTIRDGSGVMTAAQLTDFARLQAKIDLALIRLLTKQLDATN